MINVAVIEARLFSTRLPGKVMMPLAGITMLQHVIERVRQAKLVNKIILATTENPEDLVIENLCNSLGVEVYRGSNDNVMQRVLSATKNYKNSTLIQITADNPFIESEIIDKIIGASKDKKLDYICNHLPRYVPIGCEVRAYKRNILEKLTGKVLSDNHKSNVTSIFYDNPGEYNVFNIDTDKKYYGPGLRLTVDEPKDYFLASHLYEKFYIKNKYFSLNEIIEYLNKNIKIININKNVNQKSLKEG